MCSSIFCIVVKMLELKRSCGQPWTWPTTSELMCASPGNLDQESVLTQSHQWDGLSQGCTRQRGWDSRALCNPRNQDLERRIGFSHLRTIDREHLEGNF